MIDILIAERYRPILMHWILYVLIEIIVCRSWVLPPVEMRWELRTPLRCMLTLHRGCFSDSVGARLRLIEQWLNCYRQNSRENSLIKETNLSTLILCLKCLNSTKKIESWTGTLKISVIHFFKISMIISDLFGLKFVFRDQNRLCFFSNNANSF